MKPTTFDAIQSLYPDARFVMYGDDPDSIEWHEGGPDVMPTTEQIANEMQRLEAAQVAAAAVMAANTAAAIAHAKSLGFTDQMISVMYPGLIEAAISPTEPEPTFADLTKRDEPPIVDP